MPHGRPWGAMCVQRFDDSLNSAIHTTYRISLRSSSMPEPRDPLLKVLMRCFILQTIPLTSIGVLMGSRRRASPSRKQRGTHSQGFPEIWTGGRPHRLQRNRQPYPRNVSPVRRARRAWSFVLPPVSPSTSLDGRFHPLGRQAPSERIRRRPVAPIRGLSPHRISTSDWTFADRRTRGEKHARRSYPPRYAADLSRAKALGATQECVTPRGHLQLAPSSWNLTDVPASRLVGGC